MKQILSKIVWVAAIPLLAYQTSFAQTDPKEKPKLFTPEVEEILDLPVVETEEVSIASNVVTELDKQPASVTVITQEQLKYSGARTVSEALTLFVPGYFAIEDQDDVIAGFRGLAPDNNSKVLLLVNGHNLNTEFFWGPPDAVLNSPDFEYIERIEVIRGPGSVTLGQGALLGVINIITKDARKEESASVQFNAQAGLDDLYSGAMSVRLNMKGIRNFTYISGFDFNGQALRREGWAELQGNQGFAGGVVADMGHRLKRTENLSFINNFQYKNLTANIVRYRQRRDLYNFYRDREVLEQDLLGLDLGYTFKINSKINNRTSVSVIDDNYGLYSLNGTVMGGTAERRYGAKTIFNINDLWPRNRMAIGFEYRLFQMGRKNKENNNFIANVVGSFDPTTANQELTMSFEQDINLISIFFEDFYSLTDQIDLFAAFRFDQHPFWGENISPRLGVLYAPVEKVLIRASYQAGFRGAVGLHYSGGYRRDGFLRADNYGEVNGSNIPSANNIDAIAPERINSFELATNVNFNKKINLNVVGFYNTVENVIDVGVFYQDPTEFPMVDIGNDIPGDWNGYWFFKNTPGAFTQIGAEASLTFKESNYSITLSQSITKVQAATQEQEELAENANSMYLASDDGSLHYKAFPEMVTRLNILLSPIEKLNFACNALYYSDWYSPAGTLAKGGIMLNMGMGYQVTPKVEVSLQAKNLTNQNNLYPMNSNAGGPDVSPGTPAWESTTFWGGVRINL